MGEGWPRPSVLLLLQSLLVPRFCKLTAGVGIHLAYFLAVMVQSRCPICLATHITFSPALNAWLAKVWRIWYGYRFGHCGRSGWTACHPEWSPILGISSGEYRPRQGSAGSIPGAAAGQSKPR